MRKNNDDSKADLVAALVRRGLSPAEALSLTGKLGTTPADHRAARSEISDVLEFRTA
jgi:hypothetical protein